MYLLLWHLAVICVPDVDLRVVWPYLPVELASHSSLGSHCLACAELIAPV